MCLGDYLGAHPLQGGEFILFYHSPERQDCFHLTILILQNIKMSTYICDEHPGAIPVSPATYSSPVSAAPRMSGRIIRPMKFRDTDYD